MTPPTLTPAEQIRRFIERHPGEWQIGAWQGDGTMTTQPAAAVLPIFGNLRLAILEGALSLMVWIIRANGEHVGLVGHHVSMDAPLLARVSARVADAVQLRGEEGCTDTLPPWLADPVRRILRARAGELLTLAGSSPADVVSAAETLDEALCQRAPVAPADVINALQAIGMSCRWVADPVKPAAPKADPAFYRALLDAAKPPETT